MKRSFLSALFVTIAASTCNEEQALTPVVGAGFDYSRNALQIGARRESTYK